MHLLRHLNVVTQIGVRATGENSTCSNIEVGLDGCQVSINGALWPIINMTNVVMDGLRIRWSVNQGCRYRGGGGGGGGGRGGLSTPTVVATCTP